MATVNQEFLSAPMGRRVINAMIFGFAAMLVAFAAGIVAALKARPWHLTAGMEALALLGPFGGVGVGLAIFLFQRSRVARFRIEENCLVLGKKRFPLEGLVSIERDPRILCWAFRVRGNGGLGAIQGRYWSRRVGKFDAFMTGTENAVVLRWPDHVAAVSPADTEFFIHCAHSASGLK